jgi:hypothetical protein
MNKILIIIAICMAGCGFKKQSLNWEDLDLECANYLKVTFKEIATNLSYYDKKLVRIEGFFYVSFEEFAIYANRKSNGGEQGLWIDFDKKLNLYEDDKFEMFSEREIVIIGIFNLEE